MIRRGRGKKKSNLKGRSNFNVEGIFLKWGSRPLVFPSPLLLPWSQTPPPLPTPTAWIRPNLYNNHINLGGSRRGVSLITWYCNDLKVKTTLIHERSSVYLYSKRRILALGLSVFMFTFIINSRNNKHDKVKIGILCQIKFNTRPFSHKKYM